MKSEKQLQLILTLFGAKAPSERTEITRYIQEITINRLLLLFAKPTSNELFIFGTGLNREGSSVFALENLNWRQKWLVALIRAPYQKLTCGSTNPLKNARVKLAVDCDAPLEFLITGNATLVCSTKRSNENIIVYWANTTNGIESIKRQHDGLELATKHLKSPLQQIPKILAYKHSESNEALLQISKIEANKNTRQCSKDSWLESTRLAEYSFSLFLTSNEESNFTISLLKKVAIRLDGDDLLQVMRVGRLLNEWQALRRPRRIPIHGDLWHRNGLFDERGAVCGVIDWEWFTEDGIAGFDAMHCVIISHAAQENQNAFKTIRQILEDDILDERLAKAIHTLGTALILDHLDITALTCLVWLTIIYRSHIHTGPRPKHWLDDAIFSTVPTLLHSFDRCKNAGLISIDALDLAHTNT